MILDSFIVQGSTTTIDALILLPNRCTQVDITNPAGVSSSVATITEDTLVTFTFGTATGEDITRITEDSDTRELEQNTDERILEDLTKLVSYTITLDYTYNNDTGQNTFNIMQII